MLGSSYALLAFLSRMPPEGFTRTDICGIKGQVTGARIPLSLFPSFPRYGHRPSLPRAYPSRIARTTSFQIGFATLNAASYGAPTQR